MGYIEESLRKKFFPVLFRGEEINAYTRKILGRTVKQGVLGIPNPHLSTDSAYNTSKAASGEMVGSLLGGTTLKYKGRRSCVCGTTTGTKKQQNRLEKEDLDRQKNPAGI